MHNHIIILLLLSLSTNACAMRIHPEGVEPRRGVCVQLCAYIRSWCKTQAQLDEQEREEERKEISKKMNEAKLEGQAKKRARWQKTLLSAKSIDVRRVAGDNEAVLESVRRLRAESEAFPDDGTDHGTAAVIHVTTPTPTFPILSLSSNGAQLTARASTTLTAPSVPFSPTPPSQQNPSQNPSIEQLYVQDA